MMRTFDRSGRRGFRSRDHAMPSSNRTCLERFVEGITTMTTDVSILIGAPQRAAVRVMSKGSTAKTLALGTLGLAMAEASGQQAKNQTPAFGRVGLLAVTTDEVVLVSMTGAITLKPKEVVARVRREQIAAMTVGGGIASTRVVLLFTDSTAWVVEVPKNTASQARAVAAELGFA